MTLRSFKECLKSSLFPQSQDVIPLHTLQHTLQGVSGSPSYLSGLSL